MLTLPFGVNTFFSFTEISFAVILKIVLWIRQVHSVNWCGGWNKERAQTLKRAKSNTGLVPTNKLLPPPLFLATSHVKSRPSIKVGCKIKGRAWMKILNRLVYSRSFHVSFNSINKIARIILISINQGHLVWVDKGITKSWTGNDKGKEKCFFIALLLMS